MDHLPIPNGSRHRQMIVPHRNLVKYDRKGFYGFLERLGHSDHDLFAMLGDSNKIQMAESILQEWLHFGTLDMLSEISSVPIDLDQFINVDEHGVRTVTSKHWPEYFAVISKKETPFDKKQHERLEAGLNDVARILGSVTGRFGVWYHHLEPSIFFAIFVLVETLYDTLRLLSGLETHIETPFMKPSPGQFFEKRMQENNWCLASVQGVLHGNTSVGYFASLLPSYNCEPHPSCTDQKCFQVHKQVGEVTCQHADLYCPGEDKCSDAIASSSDLVGILNQGSFPAVLLQDVEGKVQAKVVDAREHEYVAISHVWAHGLGNPNANSMPACQARRLSEMVSRMSNDEQIPALWIDTFCVPFHSKPHRKMAISRLRDTYKRASKVLILDRRLFEIHSTSIPEAVCHLLCSDWMSRLWTLQEGLLPKRENLHVQFQDNAVPVAALLYNESAKPMSDIVEAKLRTYLSSLFLARYQFGTPEDGHESFGRNLHTRIFALMQNLQRRRTTRSEDEPVCIATLMGIDLEKFEGMPSMEDIYRSLDGLPRTLIFANGPRLTTTGFRWAPSTFLEQPITGHRIPEGLTTRGLVTEKGFDFMADSIKLLDPLVIEHKRTAFMIEHPGGEKSVFFLPDFDGHSGFQRQTIEKPGVVMGDLVGHSQPAVIVSITDDRRYGILMEGSYRLGGYIVYMNRASPANFRRLHFETIRGDYPLRQNWVLD